MKFMYSIMDAARLDRPITLDDLKEGRVRVRLYNEDEMELDALEHTPGEVADWWPVHDIEGFHDKPDEYGCLAAAFDAILADQEYHEFERIAGL